MQFTPKTKEEIAAMRLKPEGEYAFEIAAAEDKQSKAGKDMMVVQLNVFDAEGRIFTVTDYLVPGSTFGDKKIFEFAATIGLSAKYATGSMSAEDTLGRGGWCKIKIGKAQEKKDRATGQPTGQFFDPRNEVAWYLSKGASNPQPHTPAAPESPPQANNNINEEDVPF